MNRIFFVSILILCLIFVGLAIFSNGLIAIAILLIIYLATSVIFGPEEIDLVIERQIYPERVSPDTEVQITLYITNRGGKLEEVFIKDILPKNLEIVDGELSLLTELGANQTREITYSVQGKRGIYYFDAVEILANDYFGLIRKKENIIAQGSIFIMPHVPKIKRVAIRPRQTLVYSGAIPSRVGGAGVEFFGIREYVSGDPIRRINWKANARHPDTLYSNEFLIERVTNVGLILDARRSSDIHTDEGSLFEHQISATAAIVDSLINDGNRVGLLIYGQFLNWTYPRYGKVQRERIFQALAKAQTGDSLVFEKLDNLPTQMFPKNSQIILFSPLREDDVPVLTSIRARGYQVMIISPDPISLQLEAMPKTEAATIGARLAQIERKILFNRLTQMGCVVLNWDVAIPFDQAMREGLNKISLLAHPNRGRW